jgi:hypothetical protein
MNFRNPNRGSLYIQELCSELERASQAEFVDLEDILTTVRLNVSRYQPNIAIPYFRKCRQVPSLYSTLTKRVQLSVKGPLSQPGGLDSTRD